jgi:acyl phosphate:glycerol-3-phosphate acyltransferase
MTRGLKPAGSYTGLTGDNVSAVLVLAFAYLLGSIPSGFLLARWGRGIDIRRVGSGNTGATNVLRTSGPALAALTLALDAGKGALAVVLAQWVDAGAWLGAVAGLLAILGTITSPWLGFRGGKGVATASGVFALLAPGALVVSMTVFAVTLLLTRYVSLGSILGAFALAVATIAGREPPAVVYAALATFGLVLVRHTANVGRLLAGTERRVGQNE